MKIHEYQAKQLFARYGVPVPKGYPVATAAEAETAAKKLIDETKIPVVVVKAQIHAGGRGKGGGVKLAKNGPAEARELYVALVLDRDARRVAVMASTEGGMDIEQVAHDTPDRIHRVHVDPVIGL